MAIKKKQTIYVSIVREIKSLILFIALTIRRREVRFSDRDRAAVRELFLLRMYTDSKGNSCMRAEFVPLSEIALAV